MEQVFTPLPSVPDHPRLEEEILQWWEDEGIFEQVRDRNRGGPKWSFIDGPVTVNKKLGVHTAWGRTLKDVFQRYKALRGFDQRYQNGFDCQGLWIEVGVERQLGLNSKREIEEYGLEKFAAKCREVVVWAAEELTRGCKRLGQWMDWGNDYFTFSDTNMEYIWRFLKVVDEKGWLFLGHRSPKWGSRVGPARSQAELTQAGVYQERADPSLYVRFPLLEREREYLVVWTTTPWTLPANVAAAVDPDAQYGRRENGEWVAVARYPDETFEDVLRGEQLVGWRYRGPYDHLPAAAEVEHRAVAWEEVSLEEGTGIVHIAPGAGQEDFELGRREDLPVLTPVDEAGRFYEDYGWLHGTSTGDAADQIAGDLRERALLVEAGDVWLDAGIVPFSTLGWQNPEWIEGGYATGASRELSHADLPDQSYWEEWFPAHWVSEMREQIRLWLYSLMFMSVALTGKAPYRQVLTYEKLLDAEGREMHGSWGNLIEAEEAFERMGADVMRWLYCQQPPTQNIRFGFAPAEEVKRRLLTLWNSVKFLVDYGNIDGFRPRLEDLEGGPDAELQPLDRWVVARTAQLVADATSAYEEFRTIDVIRSFDDFVDDLSNWYIRRSRRRFWDGDEVALRTLWHALVQGVRVIAPVMPFLTEHLWRNLVPHGAASVFLAGWPEERARDESLLSEIAETRRVVRLGHMARQSAGLKVRQPLRRLVVDGTWLSDEHAAEVRDELRVKQVELGPVEATELRVKPNLPVLGPKLGKELRPVRAALEAGEFEELAGGRFRVGEHELGPDEVLVERTGKQGWAVASGDGVTVALDTGLDAELELEALVLDLIHRINSLRKEQGLELPDRTRITLPAAQKELLQHADWIKRETLAVEINTDGGSAEPQIAKA